MVEKVTDINSRERNFLLARDIDLSKYVNNNNNATGYIFYIVFTQILIRLNMICLKNGKNN